MRQARDNFDMQLPRVLLVLACLAAVAGKLQLQVEEIISNLRVVRLPSSHADFFAFHFLRPCSFDA